MTRIEEAVFSSLSPSPRIRARVKQAREAMGLPEGEAYGCTHARIERDMSASWRANRAGKPPGLSSYLHTLSKFPELHSVPRVFMAVGIDISAEDRRMLDSTRTSWGARLVRSAVGKAMPRRHKESEHSYTEAALVDLLICRDANWFVGFGGSTFTRVVARSRGNSSWITTCPRPEDSRYVGTDEGIDKWALCPPTDPKRGYLRCTFGYECDSNG